VRTGKLNSKKVQQCMRTLDNGQTDILLFISVSYILISTVQLHHFTSVPTDPSVYKCCRVFLDNRTLVKLDFWGLPFGNLIKGTLSTS